MKITLQIEKEFEAIYLKVIAGVRYWEDSDVNGVQEPEEGETKMPFRVADNWAPMIELDSGKIVDWPVGTTADIHYKVCDQCVVKILDADKVLITEFDGYVPRILCPKKPGYGDYIIMDVNADGYIQNWRPHEIQSLF